MSVKTKLITKYAIIIMVAFHFVYGVIYFAFKTITISQHDSAVQKTLELVAKNIQRNNDGTISINIEDDLNGLSYALFSADNQWLAGNNYTFRHGNSHKHHNEQFIALEKDIFDDFGYIGTLLVASPSLTHFNTLARMKVIWGVSVIPVLLISILGGYVLSVSVLKPIRDITKAARQIGQGDFSKRIDYSNFNDEVAELITTFNDMALNIQNSFSRERKFTSDASHEMRTPIAVIIASTEDAINDDNIETYRKTASLTLDKAKLMQKMLSQLLLLARDNEQKDLMDLQIIDISAVISDIVEEAKEWTIEKNITITAQLEKGLKMQGDLMLLTRMVINLINNAVKYGKNGGLVEIKTYSKPNEIVISISDNGVGIAEKDLPHIFERFYKADEARTDNSFGLGLSFVEMITKLHNGKISVESKEYKGTYFTIVFSLL